MTKQRRRLLTKKLLLAAVTGICLYGTFVCDGKAEALEIENARTQTQSLIDAGTLAQATVSGSTYVWLNNGEKELTILGGYASSSPFKYATYTGFCGDGDWTGYTASIQSGAFLL